MPTESYLKILIYSQEGYIVKLPNRRSEGRFKIDGIAEMRIARPGYGENIFARVCDISKSGLGLQINCRLTEGAKVMVQLGELLVIAEVRHCLAIGSDLYEVGVRIIDVKIPAKPKPSRADSRSQQAA